MTYVLSVSMNDYSIVDRLWSFMPPLYSWIILFHYPDNPRVQWATALISLWGFRLTFNFWRKGGYASGGEDYRWGYLRENIPPWAFQLLNITFISTMQHALLLGLTLPVLVAGQTPFQGWTVMDVVALDTMVSAIIAETVADEQQWQFHQKKKDNPLQSKETRDGFISSGLWRYSRHPNFCAEQTYWIAVTLFSFTCTRIFGTWWDVGSIFLVALFQGSTWLTEKITLSKYPAYSSYQQATSRLLPWIPGSWPGNKEHEN
ncbi:hypothetical protein BJ684DRAFT_11713 [Piptocephalis cylindrospora]|uniref:Steroid 5-alpha reductase C-terminal domain-containing protein n=1 Tax=Piptocephalis cylindrospora TaxID=1907219 RepID=A0A4P9Y2K5_9FUNG|nr:hypothetical protein BJ684DRAFT_11713 [Piptocephalis cylindrospora]|eukprot:RKP12291.1 hypothetical protein BJ684DRAFT_11713 [Piptocephalis cylindrospora]